MQIQTQISSTSPSYTVKYLYLPAALSVYNPTTVCVEVNNVVKCFSSGENLIHQKYEEIPTNLHNLRVANRSVAMGPSVYVNIRPLALILMAYQLILNYSPRLATWNANTHAIQSSILQLA